MDISLCLWFAVYLFSSCSAGPFFLWVFLRELGFLPPFFSPVGMLGSILLNLNPVCPQLLFLCAVLWCIDCIIDL